MEMMWSLWCMKSFLWPAMSVLSLFVELVTSIISIDKEIKSTLNTIIKYLSILKG